MKHPRLFLFIEGCVSVSLQFLFMRHLLPNVGSSVVTSSIIISIFLLFLAVGYHQGGKVEKDHHSILGRNMALSALILTVGLSSSTSLIYFDLMRGLGIHLALAGYCLIFMAAPVYLLGQTMPLIANDLKARSNGELSGTVLFYSTLGNVLGSLVSVLILMRFFGLGITVLANISILLSLYFYVRCGHGTFNIIKPASMFVLAAALVFGAEAKLYDMTTQYANYSIADESDMKMMGFDAYKGARALVSNSIVQSVIDGDGGNSLYIDFINDSYTSLLPPEGKVLVIGSGGFTTGRMLPSGAIDFVDIDHKVKEYAEKEFLKGPINGKFHTADAREFLLAAKAKYDVIILDTFNSKYSIPWHLASREYFQLVASKVKANGLILINTIQNPRFEDAYSRNLHATIMTALPFCTNEYPGSSARLDLPLKLINRVYVCANRSERPTVLIDRKESFVTQ